MSRSTLYVQQRASSKSENVPPSDTEAETRESNIHSDPPNLQSNPLLSLYRRNIAEQLIDKGLATALRHKRDDENRSPDYDKLTTAEQAAVAEGRGIHSGKTLPTPRIGNASEVCYFRTINVVEARLTRRGWTDCCQGHTILEFFQACWENASASP